MLHLYTYGIIASGTTLWAAPFPLQRTKQKGWLKLDSRARWGVALEGIGYTLLWQGKFWMRSLASWQTELAILLFVVACVLSWTAAFALGNHLRVDAVLINNHRLIRSGPYGIVRHPIYASMLCLLIATGTLIARWYLFVAALSLFLVGTEIRVFTEEKLLESLFGDEFRNYRRVVKGIVPLLR